MAVVMVERESQITNPPPCLLVGTQWGGWGLQMNIGLYIR
jgi:hypothetical protein